MKRILQHLALSLFGAGGLGLTGCGSGVNSLDSLATLAGGNSSASNTSKGSAAVTTAAGAQAISPTSVAAGLDPNFAAIKAIFDSYQAQIEAARQAVQQQQAALHAATIADPADPTAITAAAAALGSAKGDEAVLESQIFAAISAALGTSLPTPESEAGAGEPEQGGASEGGPRPMGTFAAGGGPQMMGQGTRENPLAAALSLTADQQTQLQTIHDNFASQFDAQRANLDAARQALRDQITAAAPDEAAIRTAATDLGVEMGNNAIIRSQELAAIRAILTPEQVTQFDALLSQGPPADGQPEAFHRATGMMPMQGLAN